jgi:SSS family solute:Na+ symporter
LIGGLFLALSYFGTDQSQVQRYLSGKNKKEIKLGLMFNALFKIPMQFLILFIGVMAFVFYQFNKPPLFFNTVELSKIEQSVHMPKLLELEEKHNQAFDYNKHASEQLASAIAQDDETEIDLWAKNVNNSQAALSDLKTETKQLLTLVDPDAETKDGDYMFISFIIKYLPVGLVGLLLAVIFSGAMSSTSAEISALASTTMVDFYKRKVRPNATEKHYLFSSRVTTLLWGLLALFFANVASLFDNLIELVNILGSLFYGTILGIFLIAFFFKKIGGTATFIAALMSEVIIVSLFFLNKYEVISIAYLWYNLIGPALVILFSFGIQQIIRMKK